MVGLRLFHDEAGKSDRICLPKRNRKKKKQREDKHAIQMETIFFHRQHLTLCSLKVPEVADTLEAASFTFTRSVAHSFFGAAASVIIVSEKKCRKIWSMIMVVGAVAETV